MHTTNTKYCSLRLINPPRQQKACTVVSFIIPVVPGTVGRLLEGEHITQNYGSVRPSVNHSVCLSVSRLALPPASV
jgi:hypothetical protein